MKVIHLIPYDGIGGVEQAAASSEGVAKNGVHLERMFVFDSVQDRSKRLITFNPLLLWSAAGRLMRSHPDLVVLSLWRAVIVGGLARLRGCRAPMVLFLHNARDAHLVDRWVTKNAARWVTAIWADSQATLDERIDLPKGVPTRVISYLVGRRDAVRHERPDPAPDFVSWGRLAAQKDPLRAIALFARIHARFPEATFTMIGPDGGLRTEIVAEIRRRGLGQSVRLTGPMDRTGIEAEATKASFFLQTSRYEGMALSVIEAMQAGLVPVVTAVGEISRYTVDGKTALWIGDGPSDKDQLVERVTEMIETPSLWRNMRTKALACWSNQPLYVDDVLMAAEEALCQGGSLRTRK